jgi:predicted dithiol-disulfide oxidoreductase (DUF899 family)
MITHEIVSHQEWLAARQVLLAEEKAWTRERDRLAAKRRALPWVKVETDYVFDSISGPVRLADLFEGRGQLVVQHFMFGPDWQEGCPGCSLMGDHIDGARQHFEHNDVSFAAVSRAPVERLDAYRKRMGWRFRWVSSGGNRFNFDFNVSFATEERAAGVFYNFTRQADPGIDDLPGMSVFTKAEDGTVYHTYSSFARGNETMLGVYAFLDIVPLGRQETRNGNLMDWVKRHDQYADKTEAASCCDRA